MQLITVNSQKQICNMLMRQITIKHNSNVNTEKTEAQEITEIF